MEINISGWFGFWIFMIMLFLLDTWIFARGYDSFLQSHKTPEEKAIQRYKIKILRIESEIKDIELLVKKDLHSTNPPTGHN